MKTKTKEKASIGWRLLKVFIIILKCFCNKTAGFICNFFIFMYPVLYVLSFVITNNTVAFIILAMVVYPFAFELVYNKIAREKIKQINRDFDTIIYSINNNFKNPQNS